jgi:hypothetical protein
VCVRECVYVCACAFVSTVDGGRWSGCQQGAYSWTHSPSAHMMMRERKIECVCVRACVCDQGDEEGGASKQQQPRWSVLLTVISHHLQLQ